VLLVLGRKEGRGKEGKRKMRKNAILFFLHETSCDRKGQLLLKLSFELRLKNHIASLNFVFTTCVSSKGHKFIDFLLVKYMIWS